MEMCTRGTDSRGSQKDVAKIHDKKNTTKPEDKRRHAKAEERGPMQRDTASTTTKRTNEFMRARRDTECKIGVTSFLLADPSASRSRKGHSLWPKIIAKLLVEN